MQSPRALLKRYLPILDTLANYQPAFLKGDLNAGLIVAVMLIPQGMAYAVLAGLPPVYGLYASMVPVLIYALFGSSRQLAVGPVAMVSLLVFTGVSQMADIGSPDFIRLALATALGVGVVQLMLGIFRAGFLVNFFSRPVLSGFVSAAAIIIGLSQLGNLLGLSIPRKLEIYEIPGYLIEHISSVHPLAAGVGIGSILLMVVLKKTAKMIPGPLVVVVLGISGAYIWNWASADLDIVGDIPTGLPAFTSLSVSWNEAFLLLPMILTISLVGYMESMAVAKAIANKEGDQVDANQELVGLGLANIFGAFFQSYPTTGGLSRTAVNYQAGAKTTLASIITVLVIGLTVLFFTPFFYHLPMTILAAIVMLAVGSLFDFHEMKYLWRTDKMDFTLLIITFLTTLLIGIKEGIIVGVALSLAVVIYHIAKPHVAELGRLGNTKVFRNIRRYKDAQLDPQILVLRFDAPLYFANVAAFQQAINDHINKKEQVVRLFVLDASAIHRIDSTGIRQLQEVMNQMSRNEIAFYIAAAVGPVRDQLQRCDLMSNIEGEQFFFDVDDAIRHFKDRASIHSEHNFSPCQTNYRVKV